MEILGLFAKTAASFEFSGSPEQAAQRLSSLIAPSIFKSWTREAVIGKATPDRVVLYRHRPFIRNSFIPRFVGRFSIENGRTVLSGAFSMHPFVRLFVVAWFSFLLVACLGSLAVLVTGAAVAERAMAALVPGAMALFGVALVRFGRWWARSRPGLHQQRRPHGAASEPLRLRRRRPAAGSPRILHANVPTSARRARHPLPRADGRRDLDGLRLVSRADRARASASPRRL